MKSETKDNTTSGDTFYSMEIQTTSRIVLKISVKRILQDFTNVNLFQEIRSMRGWAKVVFESAGGSVKLTTTVTCEYQSNGNCILKQGTLLQMALL